MRINNIDHTEVHTFEGLCTKICTLVSATQEVAFTSINQMITMRNWLIGAYIVEYEQDGNDRAAYGNNLLKKIENNINQKGITVTLLQVSRLFYRNYPQIATLVQTKYATSHILPLPEICATSHKSLQDEFEQTDITFSTPPETIISKLSFSHIRELLTVSDPMARAFYEQECIRSTWSVRELRRQISTNLHVRVGLSKDKLLAMKQVNEKAEKDTPALQIRDPYIFEFLGLRAKDVVTEDDLEQALIEHLQDFLLELGKGFCFEARQKRIIIDDQYHFIDLVFYNRALHCNVIVELKNDEFRHEHLGQLNSYVAYYKENEMQQGDNPPVGILLCTRAGKQMVRYATAGMDNNVFVSTYMLHLPNESELEAEIKQTLKMEGI